MSNTEARQGRPEFIPREAFRQWMTRGQINKLMEIDGITPGGYIGRCENLGNPLRKKGTLYRPIDLVARARAKGHCICPPEAERLKMGLQELEARYAELEAATENLPHQIEMHRLSTNLTDRTLLTAKEIIKGSDRLPHLTGVYFLIKNEHIIYVGQSVNILSRIASHKRDKEFDRFAFVPCEREDLDVLESLYIHFLRPELNGHFNGNNGHHAPFSLTALIGYKRKSKKAE